MELVSLHLAVMKNYRDTSTMVDIDMRSRNKHSHQKLLINGWQDFKKVKHPRLQWHHPTQVWEDKQNHKNSWKRLGNFPERVIRCLTSAQKSVLNNIYDSGEQSGSRHQQKAEKVLRKALKLAEYLPVSTVKSYFSRGTALKKGKIPVKVPSQKRGRKQIVI